MLKVGVIRGEALSISLEFCEYFHTKTAEKVSSLQGIK